MSVVQLNGGLFGQHTPIRVQLTKPPEDISAGAGEEEIFLHSRTPRPCGVVSSGWSTRVRDSAPSDSAIEATKSPSLNRWKSNDCAAAALQRRSVLTACHKGWWKQHGRHDGQDEKFAVRGRDELGRHFFLQQPRALRLEVKVGMKGVDPLPHPQAQIAVSREGALSAMLIELLSRSCAACISRPWRDIRHLSLSNAALSSLKFSDSTRSSI
jgi:hypothetical protein